MQELLQDSVKDVRREAVNALALIDDDEAMELLLDRILDPHPEVRARVAHALVGGKEERVREALDRLTHDEVPSVRRQARRAQEHIAAGETVSTLAVDFLGGR